MRYFLPLFFIFLTLSCCCYSVAASEIKTVEENTSCKIVMSGVPERGVGSFYLELAFDPSFNITNVKSNNFLVAYNIVNSTLVIAGAQGNVPGPTGNVILCIINYEKKTQFIILKAIVSDVDGNTILSTMPSPSHAPITAPSPLSSGGDGIIDITPSLSLTPTSTPNVTPSSTFTPTVTLTPSRAVSYKDNVSENNVTPTHTSTPAQTPSPTTSPLETSDSSPDPSLTAIPSQYWILGFEGAFTVIAIISLLMTAYLVLRRRK